MAEKMLKAKCDWCQKEIECPENMMNADKHICFDCFQKHENELGDLKPGKLHIDFPRKEFEERLPEFMARALVEEHFSKIWNEEKHHLKQLQKKELAQTMFAAGVLAAMETMKESGEQADDEEDEAG